MLEAVNWVDLTYLRRASSSLGSSPAVPVTSNGVVGAGLYRHPMINCLINCKASLNTINSQRGDLRELAQEWISCLLGHFCFGRWGNKGQRDVA
jgi:hypothetical protein